MFGDIRGTSAEAFNEILGGNQVINYFIFHIFLMY
jgi:hypothetical protein